LPIHVASRSLLLTLRGWRVPKYLKMMARFSPSSVAVMLTAVTSRLRFSAPTFKGVRCIFWYNFSNSYIN
jgi:hypothetical protein